MDEQFPKKTGRYTLLRSLGRGGMGEVFLAFDEKFQREIALKKIRSDLKDNPTIRSRFLEEAKIAAVLSHPSIIPIHSIEEDSDGTSYYTMPYIEGETLKAILHKTRLEERSGHSSHPIGSSIPMLVRIFLNACQAIAYCHNRGVLHRDIKPENILIGKFGETMIVDWGLAQRIEEVGAEDFDEEIEIDEEEGLTRPGRVVGTLAFLAPERAMREPASVLSDLYSLGVILYQILTLRLPFRRKNIKSFRKLMRHEKAIDPLEISPYRDIPHELAEIACQCIRFEKKERLPNVQHLISKVEHYLEGLPDWMPAGSLEISRKGDWEFQEPVLLAKHLAVSESANTMEWVLLMISKNAFGGNLKIELETTINEGGKGLEILFGVPKTRLRKHATEGWGIRLGSTCSLIYNQIEILSNPEVSLEKGHLYRFLLEVIGTKISAFLNGILIFTYLTPLPLAGNHIGLITRDEDFELNRFDIFVGSHNALINCLAVPDAFLAKRYYQDALEEYQRIAYSFRGRTEGREALFRIGATLLDMAKEEKRGEIYRKLLEEALSQFGTLSSTHAAPLEYLGKALVYQVDHDSEEEIKCLELSLRKASHHPLKSVVVSHILFRLHEAAYENRFDAYAIALLALQQIPSLQKIAEHAQFLSNLGDHIESLPIFQLSEDKSHDLTIQLAFWLAKTPVLESFHNTPSASYALKALRPETYGLEKKWKAAGSLIEKWLLLKAIIDEALENPLENWIIQIAKELKRFDANQVQQEFDGLLCQLYLAVGEFTKAKAIFDLYPKEAIEREKHPLFVPYGCFLRHKLGEEGSAKHFSDLSTTIYPPTSALLGYCLSSRSMKKIAPFIWQKMEMYRQEALYYRCAGLEENVVTCMKKLRKEIKKCQSPT